MRPVCRADNLTTFICWLSRNSGSLNFLGTWKPVQACNWVAVVLVQNIGNVKYGRESSDIGITFIASLVKNSQLLQRWNQDTHTRIIHTDTHHTHTPHKHIHTCTHHTHTRTHKHIHTPHTNTHHTHIRTPHAHTHAHTQTTQDVNK